jgi:PKD repeat protein
MDRVATDDLIPVSQNFGGAVYSDQTASTAVLNSILWNDVPDEVYGTVTVTYSDIEGGFEGAGNIDADPLFVNAETGDLRLQQGSPAIDAGTAEGAPDVDIRLVPRPQGCGFDMGAYEMTYNIEAVFTADVTTGPAPLTVKFTDQSTGDITSWLWNFGDGSTSTEQNPTHTYTAPGTYTVSLTVTSPDATDTETKTNYIQVTAVPPEELEVSFTFTPNFGMRPLPVQFTDTTVSSEPILSWLWRFGDGSTSTQQNPLHTYRVPGLFSVSLTVTTADQIATYRDRYAVLVTNKNGKVPAPWLLRWLLGQEQDYMPLSKVLDR